MKSAHDCANAARDCSVSATSENPFESVQPPTLISVFKFGYFGFRT